MQPNTNYTIKLAFTGYSYEVKVSEDGVKYITTIALDSTQPLKANRSILYLGIDKSEGDARDPFTGYINLGPFSVNVENILIRQWFEQTPMGEEDTFAIKADLDIGLVSSDFFQKFSNFLKRYVYPSLSAFEAKVNLSNHLTLLPFSRQKITYVVSSEEPTTPYMVTMEDRTDFENYDVNDNEGGSEEFRVRF